MEGCIFLFLNNNLSLVNSSCSTTSTGTIILYYNHTETEKKFYTAYTTLNGFVDKDMILLLGNDPDELDWGATGYIIGFFLVLVGFFMFLSVPTLSLLMGTTIFVVLAGAGLYFRDINYGLLLTLLVITYLIASIKNDSGVNA